MSREILQRFAIWTKCKFKIHITEEVEPVYFYEREVWWCALGANIGHEQDGKNENFERPVLVIKKFNQHLLWVLPMTSKTKRGKYYHTTFCDTEASSVILSQLRTISAKRLLRKIRTLPSEEFVEIKEGLKEFL